MSDKSVRDKPKVTIGVPVYNGEPFITGMLDSVLAQDYEDFEVIICDNASTDRTWEIINDYASRDLRIRCFKNSTNLGATSNYRRVLELAEGEWFKWLAADDVIRPLFLSRCMEVFEANPAVCLVYSKAAFIDENDIVTYHFDDVFGIENWPRDPVKRTKQMLQAIFANGSAANVIIFGLARTEALRKIRPLGNYFGPDFVIVTEMAMYGEIYQVPSVLSFYRRHEGSSSTYKRSPSAADQQAFLDPSVTSRFVQELQLRRRYFELFRAFNISGLSTGQKARLHFAFFNLIFRRASWRVVYELRHLFGLPEEELGVRQRLGVGRPWTEYSH